MIRLPNDIVSRLRPFYQGRRVCVTGGAGFIGGHIVDALLSMGASITVIDDLSNSAADHVCGLIDLEPERVRFVHASILDDASLDDAMQNSALVFHLAAMSSVPRSVAEPERSYAVNAVGTMRVAQAARRAGVQRIVYSASSSAYGPGEKLPKVESDTPEPISPYASSKLAGEHAMLAWAKSYAMSTVSLRYFNVFGPRQPADSPYSGVIAVFAKKLLAGETPVIFGDGEQSRDFTHVANAVLANLLAGACEKPLSGEVINVGAGQRTSLNELCAKLAAACGTPHVLPVHQPARVGDVRHSLADLTKARQLLSYAPVVELEDGLRMTLDWYREAVVEPKS